MEHGLCVFSREIFQGIQTGKTTKINTYFCPERHPGFALRETGMIRPCPTTICGTRGYLWNPRAAVHDMDVEYTMHRLHFCSRVWDLPNNKFRKWVRTCCACYCSFSSYICNPQTMDLANSPSKARQFFCTIKFIGSIKMVNRFNAAFLILNYTDECVLSKS